MRAVRSFASLMLRGVKPSPVGEQAKGPDDRGPAAISGFGDGVSKAFEVALTPILFSLIGVGIDYKLSTAPIFTMVFLAFGIAGMAVKLWFAGFGTESAAGFLHGGDSSAKVLRRSRITPVEVGDLLGGDLEIPEELDLSFDPGARRNQQQ